MRRAAVELAHDADDFLQFFHEHAAGVHSTGGVGEQHRGLARARRLDTIKDYRGAVGLAFLRDDRDLIAFAPNAQLLHGGGAEGVASGDHNAFALGFQTLAELGDASGFAAAVDADHQYDIGFAAMVDGEGRV